MDGKMQPLEVIDNFLPHYQFEHLNSVIMGDEFPWYYNDQIVAKVPGKKYTGTDLSQFTHSFYEDKPLSDWMHIIDPILDKMRVEWLFRVKANSTSKCIFNRFTGYHVDWCDKEKIPPNVYTSIFYMNTNNGGTKIKGFGKVKSVANRLVIFNAATEHAGITCTNQKRRVVINFNWRQRD